MTYPSEKKRGGISQGIMRRFYSPSPVLAISQRTKIKIGSISDGAYAAIRPEGPGRKRRKKSGWEREVLKTQS